MKFVRIKKYVERGYDYNPSFLIELDDSGVLREYISNGCQFIENTASNVADIIKDFDCKRHIDELLNSEELTNYDTITDGRYMFKGCYHLTALNLSLPHAVDCYSMLRDCFRLTQLDLSLPHAEDCRYMLHGCSNLAMLNLSLPHAVDCGGMLRGCSNLLKENIKITYI